MRADEGLPGVSACLDPNTAVRDTDVLPSAPYRYRIWSVNDRGIRSLYAAGVKVETAVDPPELRIFADHGRVTIGWDPPDDGSVTGYRILRRVQWEDEETPVGVTGRGVTSWVDRQVSPDTAYAYRLRPHWESLAAPASPGRPPPMN